jgi:hypothetical protein
LTQHLHETQLHQPLLCKSAKDEELVLVFHVLVSAAQRKQSSSALNSRLALLDMVEHPPCSLILQEELCSLNRHLVHLVVERQQHPLSHVGVVPWFE